MKIRIAHTVVLLAGLTALPPAARAILPTQQPRVNPLAGPQKAVHDAQANVEIARKQLLVIRRRVEAAYAVKPEFKAAKEAVEKAKEDYEAESRKVTAALSKDPEYVATKAKRDKAQAIIDQAHNPPAATASGDDPVKLTDQEIDTAVKDHQDAALAMIDMQKRSEANDANFAVLQQKKQDAQSGWDALQSQIDEAMKADPAYPSAQQAVDQAEASLAQARIQLASAAKSQRDAEAAAAKAKAQSGGR